jgi:cation/acetate symporter
VPLANPALFSFPIGFLCCYLGTVLSREAREEKYRELHVRAETGLGAH